MENVELSNDDENEFTTENIESFIQCFEKKFFGSEQKFVCKLCCEIDKNYTAKSSAIRLKRSHSQIYNDIKQKKTQTNDCELPKNIEIRVKVNVSDIWDAVVELVVFNSLSLNSSKSDSFQKLIRPYVVALQLKGIRLNITPETVRKKIEEKSLRIKHKIKDETKGIFLCLMTDIASRYSRSVLGVNIGFISNGCIAVRTIGMHTMRMSHTAEEISRIIRANLQEFHIETNQIIAFTTDNGRNLTKTASLFDEVEKGIHGESLMNYQLLLDNFDSDEEMDEEIFDEMYYSDLLRAVQNEFEVITGSHQFVHGIRCGSHCLHLVITQAINETNSIGNLLQKVRNLVKKLRTTKYRNLLKSKKLNILF